jgi:hypothetical protein
MDDISVPNSSADCHLRTVSKNVSKGVEKVLGQVVVV